MIQKLIHSAKWKRRTSIGAPEQSTTKKNTSVKKQLEMQEIKQVQRAEVRSKKNGLRKGKKKTQKTPNNTNTFLD